MPYFFLRSIITSFLLLASSMTSAETLSDYVKACKEQLGFDSIPQFSCKSVNFRQPFSGTYLGLDFSESSDFVAHRKVNNSVDALFACRWVEQNGRTGRAVGGEMIVHNRRTGGTCFFELKDTFEDRSYPQVSINPIPPTHSDAAKVWDSPSHTATCTMCHTAGPYIASPQIVGALAKFGLINDGHDTFNKDIKDGGYHAVGSNGSDFAERLNDSIPNATQVSCAGACHVVGGAPAVDSIIGAGLVFGAVVMPSINHVIEDILVTAAMPPSNPYSDYRWLNRDDAGGTGDYERVSDFKSDAGKGKANYSAFFCNNPSLMQVRRVDSDVIFTSSSYQYLRTFNLQDGLACYNSDFPEHHPYSCFDYQTRYKCGGDWTAWQSNDKPTGAADNEARSGFKDLCSNPTDIQARYRAPVSGAPWVSPFYGPRDRLRKVDHDGLLCKNEDQDNGKCHNYTVRFICS